VITLIAGLLVLVQEKPSITLVALNHPLRQVSVTGDYVCAIDGGGYLTAGRLVGPRQRPSMRVSFKESDVSDALFSRTGALVFVRDGQLIVRNRESRKIIDRLPAAAAHLATTGNGGFACASGKIVRFYRGSAKVGQISIGTPIESITSTSAGRVVVWDGVNAYSIAGLRSKPVRIALKPITQPPLAAGTAVLLPVSERVAVYDVRRGKIRRWIATMLEGADAAVDKKGNMITAGFYSLHVVSPLGKRSVLNTSHEGLRGEIAAVWDGLLYGDISCCLYWVSLK
jgi:hypothetical protein